MAGGDALRQLLRAYARRDDAEMRLAIDDLIEAERAKNHRLLADDLERILLSVGESFHGKRLAPSRGVETEQDIPKDRERGTALVDVEYPRYDWDRLVLPAKTQKVLDQIANEHHRRDVLAAAGLQPKQRILFYGPPGCGKTLAARVLAGVLSYPLALVRFDAVVSSYLGETAANLRKVFDFLARDRWIVLFDEFDAIGKDRDNPFEHGELKRLVNTLLQLMDTFHGESLLIAATNHQGLLDTAVWRRFETVLHFGPPTEGDRVLLLRQFLRAFDCSALNLPALARRLKGATGADIEWMTTEAARRAVLDSRYEILADDMDPAISAYRERLAAMSGSTEDAEKPLDVPGGYPERNGEL
jgi:SpoVK/Ycf46/Vps4 family AAA+-type ATPase